MSCQSRFNARYWMLGAGALGRPRGMVWGGGREEGSGWGTHVYLWQIHFDIWQNQYNIVKFKNKIKLKKIKIKILFSLCCLLLNLSCLLKWTRKLKGPGQLHLQVLLWPWSSHDTSPSFCFATCKTKIIIADPGSPCCDDECCSFHKAGCALGEAKCHLQ